MRLLFLILLLPSILFAQQQERKVLLYNIGFGALSSGIGAVINKPKGGNWKHYFLKGFWQGSIGGALNYTGKKTIYLVNKNQNLLYAWPAKLLHDAGTSIIENAALNEPFLQNWNTDFGPVRFDFSINGNKKFRARFLPVSIYSVIAGFSKNNFALETTLLTGNVAFKRKPFIRYRYKDGVGSSYGRAFDYTDNDMKYHIIAHELIHQFQYTDYEVFNSWLKPLEVKIKWKGIKTVFSKYVYLDIPFSLPAYGLEGRHDFINYYKNYYEFEAERFATNRFVTVE